jgi:hypothetical protein
MTCTVQTGVRMRFLIDDDGMQEGRHACASAYPWPSMCRNDESLLDDAAQGCARGLAATGLILAHLFLSQSRLFPAALCRGTPDAHAKVLLTKRNGANALERRLPLRQRARWA